MIEGIHKHLLTELDRAGRADTIFVLSGIGFNLLVLAINWAQAGDITRRYVGHNNIDNIIIFIIFLLGSVIVTTSCLLILRNNKNICYQCHTALLKIYADTDVEKYMPSGMTTLGNKRFNLSVIVVAGTGLIAVIVPLVVIFAK
ncbi:MAG: hypothetical protein OEZ39_16260 [Gammaproteobacteria bacterium]|nr:hypothetical protein [Gammaproteobacteria bacterium]MDH5653413.1 hypothetical protein [Gammaproteobacteria bacterium]